MSINYGEKTDITKGLDFLLLPRPVVLVTCVDDGKPNVITIAWASPVSHDPLVVAIAISPKRYSHSLVDKGREFVVNLPGMELAEASNWCGRKSGRKYDKFETCNLHVEPAKVVKPPVISECYAHLECKVIQQVVAGDHTTFFGEVVAAYACKDAIKPVTHGGPPSLYFDPKVIKTLQHLGGDMYLTNTEDYEEFTVGGVIDV